MGSGQGMPTDLLLERVRLLTGVTLHTNDLLCHLKIKDRYRCLFKTAPDQTHEALSKLIKHILYMGEEASAPRDKFGRFDRNSNLLVKTNLDQIPVIDQLLRDTISELGLQVRSIWPQGKKAVVCLTHDVDNIDGFSHLGVRKAYWRFQHLLCKARGKEKEAKKWLEKIRKWDFYKKSNNDPMDCFDKIISLENSYGFRSTFYFMSLRNSISREGRRYNVQDPRLAQITRQLLKDGFEVGLHAAYYGHLSGTSLIEQKKRLEEVLGSPIYGCRHHYLRVRYPLSWSLYAQAGLEYSSNVGWDGGFNGFRAGTCLPYQPLLPNYSIWEIPFQLMDKNPMIDQVKFANLFKEYLSRIKEVGGCLVIDFHQENFNEEEAPGTISIYNQILETIANDNDLSVLTMKEVSDCLNKIQM